MGKVLRLTDQVTGRVTVIPDNTQNRKQYKRLNKVRPQGQGFHIEEDLDEDNLPPEKYGKNQGQAASNQIQSENEELKAQIKQLMQRTKDLEAALTKSDDDGGGDDDDKGGAQVGKSADVTAAQAILILKSFTSAADVQAYTDGDARASVQAEAQKFINKLNEQ